MSTSYNYLKANEKPDAVVILQRMSEWGVCLLTGAEDVTAFPVDLELSNILGSNMACVAKSLVPELAGAFNYKVGNTRMEVQLTTPQQFEQYNRTIWENLEFPELPDNPSWAELIQVWQFLTGSHLKGISKLTLGSKHMEGNEYFITWDQYQKHCIKQLSLVAKASSIHLLK